MFEEDSEPCLALAQLLFRLLARSNVHLFRLITTQAPVRIPNLPGAHQGEKPGSIPADDSHFSWLHYALFGQDTQHLVTILRTGVELRDVRHGSQHLLRICVAVHLCIRIV